jgi:hypothetical protein
MAERIGHSLKRLGLITRDIEHAFVECFNCPFCDNYLK